MFDFVLGGAAGTVANTVGTVLATAHNLALGSTPPAGAQPGSGGRMPGSDTGAQNACSSDTSPPANTGISNGSGAGTNLMPWYGENCNWDPGGCGDNPTCNAGGTCSGTMPTR